MEAPALTRRLPRLADERGFTLIELLIVILVIGVLAAIAIPMFTGKRERAYDADAKSSAHNLSIYMDSCYVPNEDFTKCSTQADAEAEDLDWGTNPGQVSVVDSTKDSYELKAVSKGETGGVANTFTIVRDVGKPTERNCTGSGGCKNGHW
jgi:type IV pilus assembly protein PilA